MILSLKTKARHSSLIAVTLLTFSSCAARADLVINRFDSAAEVAAWKFDNGLPGGSFAFDATQDAGSNSSSGSMKLVMPFTGNGGFEYTLEHFPVATDLTAAGYTNISLDVKVDPTSPAADDGMCGWFQLAIRADGDQHSFLRQYGENLNINNGWLHISVPITGDVTATRGFTFQFSSGDFTNGTRTAWIDNLVLQGGGLSQKPAESAAVSASDEMLVNGDFADGITNWVVAESGATGEAAVVAEGPGGKPALRLKVLTVGDKPWKLQVYQPGMRFEQGKEYVLTLWAKASHAGEITVNCQQNHEPWEHHTQKKVPVTAEWQQVRFPFVAPWTDDKIRISFTDLGTTPDQIYWFAKCSLMPAVKGKASASAAPAAAKSVIVLKQPIGTYSSPVAAHGALQVIGNHVCDAHGEPYQLKGMSLFWSHWSGRFYTKETVDVLAENWRCSVVRAATGAEPGEGGYLDNPTAALAKLKAVVDAAIAKGIYVIIDWHKEHQVAAPSQVAEATAFFTQMATTYGSYPNVIFEIYNEPNGPHWPAVKAYAETVIGAIRKTGSTNLIIVGTPKWSQDVDIAAADPITDFKNIAYALHFYAGTPDHKPLRGKATAAMNKGIALFVTEWGTCDSSGNGGLDLPESVLWMNFLKENSISWANWSLHDKAETTSTLKPGTRVTGPPSGSDLTPSGVFVYNNLVAP